MNLIKTLFYFVQSRNLNESSKLYLFLFVPHFHALNLNALDRLSVIFQNIFCYFRDKF